MPIIRRQSNTLTRHILTKNEVFPVSVKTDDVFFSVVRERSENWFLDKESAHKTRIFEC